MTPSRHTSLAPSRGEVLDELDQILASEAFRHSARMRRLLRFVVIHRLNGASEPLKEALIAEKVFDKPGSFDPRIDPIVRVEASRLRAKLRDFYHGEGSGHSTVIQLPSRGYAPTFEKNGTPAPVRPPAPEAAGPSLLVLPFLDLSAGHSEDYFCDGLTEELINQLARVDGIRVVSRTSAFEFKGQAADVREIAARWKATLVVEGSVRRENGAVRVSVQLLDAVSGYHLWADTYERPVGSVFAIQAEITGSIAAALSRRISEDLAAPRRDWEAYQAYLRGLHAWNRRTPDGFREAEGFLEAAIARDGAYFEAWAKLAHCGIGLLLSSAVDPRVVAPRAERAAQQAIAVAPESGEALAALAFLRAIFHQQPAAAEAGFLRAMELAPSDPTVHEWYAIGCLVPSGRHQEAARQLQTAVELDPASAVIHAHLGLAHYLSGAFEQAIQQLCLAVDMEPGFIRARWDLGMAMLAAGAGDEAIRVLELARDANPQDPHRWGALGYGYAKTGRVGKARDLVSELRRTEHYVSPACLADIHAGLGEWDRAAACLNEARLHHAPRWIWSGFDPVYSELRTSVPAGSLAIFQPAGTSVVEP